MSLLLDAIKKAEQRKPNEITEAAAGGSKGASGESEFAGSVAGSDLGLSIDMELLEDSPDLTEANTATEPSPRPAAADDISDEVAKRVNAAPELSLEADPPAALEAASLDVEPTIDRSKISPQTGITEPADPPPTNPLSKFDPSQSGHSHQRPDPQELPAEAMLEPVPKGQPEQPDERPLPRTAPATPGLALEQPGDVATGIGVSHPPYSSAKQKKLGFFNLAILLVVGLIGVAIFYYLDSRSDQQPVRQQPLPMTNGESVLEDSRSVNVSANLTLNEGNQPIANAPVEVNQQPDQHSTEMVDGDPPLSSLSGTTTADETSEPPFAPAQAVDPQFNLATRNNPNDPNNRIDPGFIQPQPTQNLIIRRTLGTEHTPARQQAKTALQTGDLASAERLYRQWLQQQPQSLDARFGLAKVAAMRGDSGTASALYIEILQMDPDNPAAQASLFNLPGLTSKQSLRRLQALLSANPDNAYLNYVMGNHHARAARWKQAQKYYFDAYSAQHDNAVYAFNLAIALDQLDQANAAAGYYRRAIEITGIPLSEEARQQSQDRLTRLAAATANQQ